MNRKERWIRLIDSNLDYLLKTQEADGRAVGEPVASRATAQMASTALWTFTQPSSRHCKDTRVLDCARRAMDLLSNPDTWRTCPFTPSYLAGAILALEAIEAKEEGRYRQALASVLTYQRQMGHHTPGNFSDWDVLYSLSLALGWKLFGDEGMKEEAARHARLVWASVVPGGEGFYYGVYPFMIWPPSVNYTGISTATLARYYEVSGDTEALAMIKAVKDFFLYHVEPWGLTEFTSSPWHKHTTDTKEDTFAFVAASAEFLAPATGDRRLNQVAEAMLGNLEALLKPDGSLKRRMWKHALINDLDYDPNTTGYLCLAAEWCKDGQPEPLPDGYISERRSINTFKARSGDFGYSVVCGDSYSSLCGAWVGWDSALEEAIVQVADERAVVYGQVSMLWKKSVTSFPDGFAQSALYRPAEVLADCYKARWAQWQVYQTYIGTKGSLVGVVSLESLVDQGGEYVAVDLHVGPAGKKVRWGCRHGEGEAMISPDNSEPALIARLDDSPFDKWAYRRPTRAWVQYGRMGICLLGASGKWMSTTCWDGAKRSLMFHDTGDYGYSSVVSNDLVISCATPRGAHHFEKGARYNVIFTVAPARDAEEARSIDASGRFTVVPIEIKDCHAVAVEDGRRILLVVVSHTSATRPIVLKHLVPQGDYEVTVFADESKVPIRKFAFSGREFAMDFVNLSPAVVVEMARVSSS